MRRMACGRWVVGDGWTGLVGGTRNGRVIIAVSGRVK